MLPFRNKIIHVRWSGESAWIPLGDLETNLDFENHTSHPAPGEILLYPGGYSETEILFPYGGTCFASIVGQLAGNHFLTVTEGREQLRELGRLVLWEGAQDVGSRTGLTVTSPPLGAHVGRHLPRSGTTLRATRRGRSMMRRVDSGPRGRVRLCARRGCGGDDDSEEPAEQGSEPQQEAKQGGDLTVMYAADVDKIDPGADVLPVRHERRLRDPAPALLVQARRREQPRARPRRGAAGDRRGRQDGHGEDPDRREVQPAGQPRGDLGRRQVRARARLQTGGRGPVRGRLHGRPGRA